MSKIESFKGEHNFLSNFYPIMVFAFGQFYPSVEHAYQAGKTENPKDQEKIRTCGNAAQAKRLGQQVKVRPLWDKFKPLLMATLLERKFENQHMAKMLLATGNAELIEGNWWGDTYWGVCKGEGKNTLGVLLMRLRDKLRVEYKDYKPRCCICRTKYEPLTFFNKGGVVDLICSECNKGK